MLDEKHDSTVLLDTVVQRANNEESLNISYTKVNRSKLSIWK